MPQEERGPVIRLAIVGLDQLQKLYEARIGELETDLASLVEAI